jgi:selenocysteine-specific elongation factor
MARMILLDRDELAPGEECCIQLVLETPLAVVAGDRFVIRSCSPVTTIGGGVIVDPLPAKHKRSSAAVLREFGILAGGDDEERMTVILGRAGIGGITENLLVVRTGIRGRELRRRLEGMFSAKRAVLVDRDEMRVLSYPVYEAFQAGILEELRGYHERNPLREGLSREELDAYLTHQLKAAGVSQTLFDDTARQALYQATKGIPRKVNKLAMTSLRLAAALKAAVVNEAILLDATTEALL